MSMSDPISDFLTRIRNACRAYKDEVSIPASKTKKKLAQLFKDEGFLEDYTVVPDRHQGLLVLKLRYDDEGRSVIKNMRRQSRPGRRLYVSSDAIPCVRKGMGTAILSTSKGILSDRQARREKVGGEYLCSIW